MEFLFYLAMLILLIWLMAPVSLFLIAAGLVVLVYDLIWATRKREPGKVELFIVFMISFLVIVLSYYALDDYQKKLERERREEWYHERPVSSAESHDTVVIDAVPADDGNKAVEPQRPADVKKSAPTKSGNSSSRSYSSAPDYFQQGYNDGYEDGTHLEKGRSYDNTLRGEAAREYRKGYFEGYPDGRADNDPDDECLWGRNGADYYDLDDDDDWSEYGDFDD